MTRAGKRRPAKDAAPAAPAPLRLEGELSIYRAEEIRQALLAALAADGDVGIDLTDVSEVDTAGVQLLLAARASAATAGKTLRVTAMSPAVEEVLALFDLAPVFEATPA